MIARELLKHGAAVLKEAGVSEPWFEAQLLMSWALGKTQADVIAHDLETLTAEEANRFCAGLRKRRQRAPLAYITGKKSFMNWDFHVEEGVLIPRPESEVLVELAALQLKSSFPEQSINLADIGVGSGAIGLSLLMLLPTVKLFAVDLSSRALAVAKKNAAALGIGHRVKFYEGDLLEPLWGFAGQLHCIVANLPYIPSRDYEMLQPEIQGYEPRAALVSGVDGLNHYRRLLAQARDFLRPAALLFVEIGWNQDRLVRQLFTDHGFSAAAVVKDLAGLPRVVWGKRKDY